MNITKKQYINLADKITDFNDEYPKHFQDLSLHANAKDCSLICQRLCQKLFDFVEPCSAGGSAEVKAALINAVGILIENKKYVKNESYVDFSKEQTLMILDNLMLISKQNKSPNPQQRAHLIAQFSSRIKELKVEFGPEA